MTDETNSPASLETCPECQVGALTPGAVPYYAKLEGILVYVANFPAWICDICRHCEYDEDALDALRVILGPSAQIPSLPGTRKRIPAGTPSLWPRTSPPKGSK
jgi:YgiT-type zinc finger domain-containing protein